MPRKTKKAKKEILQAWHEKRRQRMKDDPLFNQEQKIKWHLLYLKRKEEKKILSIREMSKREQEKQRRIWRINKRNSIVKQKQRKHFEKTLTENIPSNNEEKYFETTLRENTPTLDNEEEVTQNIEVIEEKPQINNNDKKKKSKKIRSQNRIEYLKDLLKLNKKIDELKRKIEKYKKRYHQVKEKSIIEKEVVNILELSEPAAVYQNLMMEETVKEEHCKKSIPDNTSSGSFSQLGIKPGYNPRSLSKSSVLEVPNLLEIKKGKYILVNFPGQKRKTYSYVSLCLRDPEPNGDDFEIEIISFKSIDMEKRKFQLIDGDYSFINGKQIVKILHEPKITIFQSRHIYEFSENIPVHEL